LFESYLPRAIQVDQLRRLQYYLGVALREPGTIVSMLQAKARQFAARRRYLREPEELPIDGVEATQEVVKYQRMVRKLGGHVMVFRSSNRDWPEWFRIANDLGWARLAERVSLHEVPADHLGLMRNPHAALLAQTIQQALAAS